MITAQNEFWPGMRFVQLWKDILANRAEMAALVLAASSVVSFHVFWPSLRPHGVNVADLPEGGVK